MAVTFTGEVQDINDAETIRRLKKKLTHKDLEISNRDARIKELETSLQVMRDEDGKLITDLKAELKDIKEANYVLRRDYRQLKNETKRSAET